MTVRFRFSSSSITAFRLFLSRAEVGSSAIISFGCSNNARIMLNLCRDLRIILPETFAAKRLAVKMPALVDQVQPPEMTCFYRR